MRYFSSFDTIFLYFYNCRYKFRLIGPRQYSIFDVLQVSAPTNEEIVGVLQLVCKKEGLNLPSQLAEKIAEKSRRNLRRALLMTETCKVEK